MRKRCSSIGHCERGQAGAIPAYVGLGKAERQSFTRKGEGEAAVKKVTVKVGELVIDAQFVLKIVKAHNGRSVLEVQARDKSLAEWCEYLAEHGAHCLTTRAKIAT